LEEALQGVDLIQENIAEDLSKKRAILEKIDQINNTAIFCSSSSAIKISLISQKSKYPNRCVGAHPFNPPHLIPLVELTQWEKTDPECVRKAYDFYKKVRKEPIILNKEVVGFIGNRLQFAYTREAVDLVMKGVCSVEDVDKASLYGLGFRYAIIGPNLNGDLNGGENGLRDYYGKYGQTMNDILEDVAKWDKVPVEYGQSIGPEGVEKAKANRPKELGNKREEILAYRDRMLLEILKLHNKI
jgi:3-hydroxyacyl-CoA dehydrogenase